MSADPPSKDYRSAKPRVTTMSDLFNKRNTYRFTLAYESDIGPLSMKEIVARINEVKTIRNVETKEIQVAEMAHRLKIYYQSDTGLLPIPEVLSKVQEGRVQIHHEGEQEVLNEDGIYTNIEKLITKICTAKGCTKEVVNKTSIEDQNGTSYWYATK
jgi:hypothetical protein